jgi:hypothetical protein
VIWLPDNLVVGVASPLENRFLIIPDKLIVRCPISIEPILQRGRCANDDPDRRYRVVKCEDGNVCENLYPTNSLWQIESLQPDDLIIALDPDGQNVKLLLKPMQFAILIRSHIPHYHLTGGCRQQNCQRF